MALELVIPQSVCTFIQRNTYFLAGDLLVVPIDSRLVVMVRVSSPFFLPLFPIIFLYFKRRNVLSYLLSPLTPERAEDQKSAREESIKAPRAYK